jgi:hypothetical protein
MKKIGMKYNKLAHIPAKAEPEKQLGWLKDTFFPCLEAAHFGQCQLLFNPVYF